MISSFVLTGFLGVGKTTMLINSVQKHFKDENIAVVVNEFGDVGVDSTVLKNVYSDVLEIAEGCICCQLSDEFEKGINEIIDKFNPSIIFIETSGASEPIPIYSSLQNLGISVDGIICVVDSKNFHEYKDNITAQHQVGGSNIIVLNKIDLVDERELIELEKEVRIYKEQHNTKNLLTLQPVFKNYVLLQSKQGLVSSHAFEGLYKASELVELTHSYDNAKHTLVDDITQKVAFLKEGCSYSEVDTLLGSLPKNIFRVKGIVKMSDHPHAMFFNYSFGAFSAEEILDYDGKSVLVFIGENVGKSVLVLEKMFEILSVPKFSVNKKS